MITYPPVNVDIRHRIDQVFLPVGVTIVTTKIPGKITQNWNMLLLYQKIVGNCRRALAYLSNHRTTILKSRELAGSCKSSLT